MLGWDINIYSVSLFSRLLVWQLDKTPAYYSSIFHGWRKSQNSQDKTRCQVKLMWFLHSFAGHALNLCDIWTWKDIWGMELITDSKLSSWRQKYFVLRSEGKWDQPKIKSRHHRMQLKKQMSALVRFPIDLSYRNALAHILQTFSSLITLSPFESSGIWGWRNLHKSYRICTNPSYHNL